jgi:dienelactone hydrolase
LPETHPGFSRRSGRRVPCFSHFTLSNNRKTLYETVLCCTPLHNGLGLLGFSLGGFLALQARAATKPRALVAYFPPIFEGIGPPGSVPFAQIHHGKKDAPPTDFANAALIESMLRLEGTDVKVWPYEGATHGFATGSVDDKKASLQSKAETLKFFAARL